MCSNIRCMHVASATANNTHGWFQVMQPWFAWRLVCAEDTPQPWSPADQTPCLHITAVLTT